MELSRAFFRKRINQVNGTIDSSSEYGSHFIPLTFAVLNTKGPILEMGIGHYSTPLLHVLCMNSERKILSADTSKDWLNNFKELENEWHKFEYVSVYEDDWQKNPKPELWESLPTFDEDWGLVFIDHRPGERRVTDILKYKDSAELVVVHDTQQASYKYEAVFSEFKYRLDYKRFPTWTTIVSNHKPLNSFIF